MLGFNINGSIKVDKSSSFHNFHAYPKRLKEDVSLQELVLFRPLMISNTKTPKLKTSDFSENLPSIAYSGAMYPKVPTTLFVFA